MGFIKELGRDTPCFKIPRLIKKPTDFSCSYKIILGRQGKVNLNANVSPSGEWDGIFSMFAAVVNFFLGCNMLGSVLQSQSMANPIQGCTSKRPKPDVKPTWAAAGSLWGLGRFLAWVSSNYFPINCGFVMWKSLETPASWDIFSIKMSQSFRGSAKMPPCVGMRGSCLCLGREESDPELFNTFEDGSWE